MTRLIDFASALVVGAMFLVAVNVSIALATCPDVSVRPNSPCKTEKKVCTRVGMTCPGNGETLFNGDFQCDQPSSGNTCMGSGAFADCRLECECIGQGTDCVTNNNCQGYQAETKTTVPCAGT